MNKLIVILGPTATGKTKLAISLAKQFNAEIVSADSRQIYKDLNIGTGKDIQEYGNIPYHLVNILAPNKQFTLAEYQALCFKIINQIIKKNKLPILIGGTGLYISSIVNNYSMPSNKPNPKIRRAIEKLSLQEKIKQLKKLDSSILSTIDIKNPRRINRALELCMSGIQPSTIKQNKKSPYDILQIGINIPKNILNHQIDLRVDKMIKQGLIKEAKYILTKYGPTTTILNTIGYAEIVDYINKKITLTQAINLIKIHTHQYAKRQLTWFKKNKDIHWISNINQAQQLIKQFID